MSKSGQARVPTAEQQALLFENIQQHRHPEKNTAIMQISFMLGLRAQEIALLQLKEVTRLGRQIKNQARPFELLEIMPIDPLFITQKGAPTPLILYKNTWRLCCAAGQVSKRLVLIADVEH